MVEIELMVDLMLDEVEIDQDDLVLDELEVYELDELDDLVEFLLEILTDNLELLEKVHYGELDEQVEFDKFELQIYEDDEVEVVDELE